MFVPRFIQEITPEWLTEALRLNSGFADTRVSFIESQPIGEQGVNGDLFKLNLTYSNQGDAPDSIVAKIPVQKSLFDRSQANWINRRETAFYRQMGPDVGIPVPTVYFAESDEDRDAHTVLMQDLTTSSIGDDETGLSEKQIGIAIDTLAQLHAKWWDDPKLNDFDWIIHPEKEIQFTAEQASVMWRPGRELVVEIYGPQLAELCDFWIDNYDQIRTRMAQSPFTLCHGDYRAGNLFFNEDNGASTVVVIDWQRSTRSKAVRDLAYLLATALRGRTAKQQADELVEKYHRNLVERGVSGYPLKNLLSDIPLGLGLSAFAVMVFSNGRPDPRGYLQSSWINGVLQMAEAYGTLDALKRH